jgi:predicted Fe-Mo cluster-binding NifX family protein
MEKLKIAIPTKAYASLDDTVSEVFGKAKTFTIADIENDQAKNVRVIDNPAASYDYGAGPVAAKTLADLRINVVLAAELGPGASGLLKHHGIRKISVKPDTRVADVIKENFGRAESKNK